MTDGFRSAGAFRCIGLLIILVGTLNLLDEARLIELMSASEFEFEYRSDFDKNLPNAFF